VVIYFDRYYEVEFQLAISPQRGDASAPLLQMVQAGSDLSMHANELQDAIDRNNLASTKRHAEHLVNLIEGDNGLRYGDVDINGTIEDPGDGTGLLVYVAQVADAAGDPRIATLADQLTAQLTVVRDNAQSIALAADLTPARELSAETVSIARRANAEGISTLNVESQAAGVIPMPYREPPPPGTPPPQDLIIDEDFFAFLPYEVTIDPGTTVVWINKERAKHTATSDEDGIFDSGDQDLGDAYEFTFTTPGDYPYFCRYHGDKGLVGMAGIIHVSDE
jgi:plastocyanin